MDKILRRRFGVAPDIDMEKGTAILVFSGPTRFDFAAFADALEKSSHRLRSATLEVAGRFEGDEFLVRSTDQRFKAELGALMKPTGTVRVRAVVNSWDAPVLKIAETKPVP